MLCLLGALGLPGVLDVAKSFLGIPYVGGTLESDGEECLIVDTMGMDCTTFVELSVARFLAARDSSFAFEQHVQRLRYRRGGTFQCSLRCRHHHERCQPRLCGSRRGQSIFS